MIILLFIIAFILMFVVTITFHKVLSRRLPNNGTVDGATLLLLSAFIGVSSGFIFLIIIGSFTDVFNM